MRQFLPTVICAASIGCCALAAGCGDEPSVNRPSAQQVEKALAGAPAPLAALHAQANELLGGGADAFEQRLQRLKGHPIVVNKWASWCAPCREEFPHFQSQALERGKRVAFLGVDSNDNDGEAREFLAQLPVSYPSYSDPDLKVSAVFNGVTGFPTTAFYDSSGELAYVKQGVYSSEKQLAEDIERYAR